MTRRSYNMSDALYFLKRPEGVTAKQLADELGMSQAGAGRLIEHAIKVGQTYGLIYRKGLTVTRATIHKLVKAGDTSSSHSSTSSGSTTSDFEARVQAEVHNRMAAERRNFEARIRALQACGMAPVSISQDDWRLILRAIHPDNSASTETRTKAFQILNPLKDKLVK